MAYGVLLTEIKDKEIASTVVYILENNLNLMESQLGYVKGLDVDIIKIWTVGNLIEVKRTDWIKDTEEEIETCKAHIEEMQKIIS